MDYPRLYPPLTNLPREGVEEMDTAPICSECDEVITDDCYYNDPGYMHEGCFFSVFFEEQDRAEAYAKENVQITHPLPTFKLTTEWTITPEEYELDRTSNTENAYRTCCRHEYTNYDVLIEELSKDSAIDDIWYEAIRYAVDNLINEEILKKDLIVFD